jgi:general transcription factor 3C protein 4
VVQGLLPGLPPDLSLEAQNLSANLNASLHGIDQAATGLNELCPACHVEVPLVDITNALCANGHAWGKFSLVFSFYYMLI